MNNNATYTTRRELSYGNTIVSTYSTERDNLILEEIYHNNMLSQSDEYINKNGIIYKIQKKFFENGNILEFSEFVRHIRVGLYKKYYNNGNLQFIKNYNNQGQLHGISTIYDRDGFVITTTNYYNGNVIQ